MDEQEKFIATFTSQKSNQINAVHFKDKQLMTKSFTKLEKSATEPEAGEYMSVYSLPTNNPECPDESEFVMNSGIGSIHRYKWTVAFNTLGFFKIKSNERCELLYYGNDVDGQYRYGINSVNHEGSTLVGLTGPISWTETGNFNYFQPGRYHVYFNVIGTLSVAGTGSIEVNNSRYANGIAIAGYPL